MPLVEAFKVRTITALKVKKNIKSYLSSQHKLRFKTWKENFSHGRFFKTLLAGGVNPEFDIKLRKL